MENRDDFIMVRRKDAAKFIKDFCVANYATQLFTYLAQIKKLEIHMDTDEVCEMLDITRPQLDRFSRKGLIKSFVLGNVRFYSAYDIVELAERVHRPARMRMLNKIPGIAPDDDKQQ
jgi:hypothetical protein